MPDFTLIELHELKDTYQKDIAKYELLQKLYHNEDFKKLILEDYCINYCANLITQSTSQSNPPEFNAMLIKQAQGAGYLKQYFNSIKNNAEVAYRDISQISNDIDTYIKDH